jgi:YVTN family beta-propeller protein
MRSRIAVICCSVFANGIFAAARLFAAATPSPALLVLDKEDSSLAIVDPGTKAVVGRVPTGEAPHEVAVSDDGKLAFVSNYGARTPGHTLSVIDLEAQKETHRVNLGPMGRPHGLAYSSGKLYFTAERAKLIGRYDPGANRVDWLLGTGQNSTHMILFNRSGEEAFTSNIGSNTVTAIAMSGNWDETVIPVGKGPEGIDISPDGAEVWSASSRDGGISIIDPAARTVKQTFNIGTKRSNRVKFAPDGKRALVSDLAGNELVVVDAVKREVIKRLNIGRQPEGILIVPAGSAGGGEARAYVAVAGDDRIAILDLATLEVSGHIATGHGPDGMAWAIRK